MIDAHHHLWRYSPEEYPWIPPASPLACDRLLPELETAVAGTGIRGTIAVQARQTEEETSFLLGLAARSPLILGVVGWLPLVSPDLPARIGSFAANPSLRGLRHVLQDEPDDYFVRDDFHRGLSLLPRHRLRYDLLIRQRQIPAALRLLDRQPGLPVVLDHLAKPEARNGRVETAWLAGMRELARRENLVGVKFSGLVTEFPPGDIDLSTLRAYFHETLALFGPRRVMFGSDWPVSLLRLDAYAGWVDTVRLLAGELGPSEQEAFFSLNALRAYGLESTSPDSSP